VVSEGDDGRALLFCHAGCSLPDVLRPLGLEVKDLFPRSKQQVQRQSMRPKSLPGKVRLQVEGLRRRKEWPFEWNAAVALAVLPREAMQQEVLRNWDFLTRRGDVGLITETAAMLRGVAILNFGSAKHVDDPAAIKRWVHRAVEDNSADTGRVGRTR
jgi:hypothetical protein